MDAHISYSDIVIAIVIILSSIILWGINLGTCVPFISILCRVFFFCHFLWNLACQIIFWRCSIFCNLCKKNCFSYTCILNFTEVSYCSVYLLMTFFSWGNGDLRMAYYAQTGYFSKLSKAMLFNCFDWDPHEEISFALQSSTHINAHSFIYWDKELCNVLWNFLFSFILLKKNPLSIDFMNHLRGMTCYLKKYCSKGHRTKYHWALVIIYNVEMI